MTEGGIFAAGFAFAADSAEAVGVDGQAEEFVFVLHERLGQTKVVKVVFGERVVGGEKTELQSQVEAGRRFARAGHANEDDVCLVVMAGAGTIVVVQGEMHGVDTDSVRLRIADGVALIDLVA